MSKGALTIVHVTEASPSLRDDTEHVLESAGALADRGHHVVLVSRPDSDLARRCSESGVVHVPMPLRHRLDFRSARRLAALLRAQAGAIVHSHGVTAPAVAVAALRRAPLSRLAVEVDSTFPLGWRARLVLRSPRVQTLVATGRAVREVVTTTGRLAPDRVLVVQPGVECPPPHSPPTDRGEARRRLGVAPGTAVVGQAGMLLWQGWRELLHALPRLRDEFPRLLVLLAGSASRAQRRTVLRVVNEMGLRDCARVTPPELDPKAVLPACDVVVDSSWAGSGFPWAAARAMALARPVVVTAVGGSGEIVQDGVSGILVPAREPSTLAAAIARLLRDPDLAAGMGLAGQHRIREQFSLASSADRLEALYRTSLQGVASPPD